jgi:hypothetical protein
MKGFRVKPLSENRHIASLAAIMKRRIHIGQDPALVDRPGIINKLHKIHTVDNPDNAIFFL